MVDHSVAVSLVKGNDAVALDVFTSAVSSGLSESRSLGRNMTSIFLYVARVPPADPVAA